MLVTPVLDQGATSVDGYFPASHWYDYYNASLVVRTDQNGRTVRLDSPIDHIPLHIRGGFIVPTQDAGLNTASSRLNPFGLIVAPDNYDEARGDLFYDDGETDVSTDQYFYATFSLRENVLQMQIEKNRYEDMRRRVLNTVRIFVPTEPNTRINFVVNKDQFVSQTNIKYEANQIVLTNLNLPMTEPFEIFWTAEPYLAPGSFGPIIDCSPDNAQVNQSECTAKGCFFYSQGLNVPQCFVPESKGEYNRISALTQSFC